MTFYDDQTRNYREKVKLIKTIKKIFVKLQKFTS